MYVWTLCKLVRKKRHKANGNGAAGGSKDVDCYRLPGQVNRYEKEREREKKRKTFFWTFSVELGKGRRVLDLTGRNPQNKTSLPSDGLNRTLSKNSMQAKSKRLSATKPRQHKDQNSGLETHNSGAVHCGNRRPSAPDGGIRWVSHHESSPAGERTNSPLATSPAINRVRKIKAKRGAKKISPRFRCRFPSCCFPFRC
jgi:hypothetical protein